MVSVKGKHGIKATVVCDSVNNEGVRITTMELEYPRIIHSELMTHRMLSRNAASSRAIPFNKMLDQLGARPVRFGQANPGMQDKGVDFDAGVVDPHSPYGSELPAADAWEQARADTVQWAESFYEAGFHKQIYNRLLEPFQFIKVVVTATEWKNFFWLRCDSAADPTIDELAICVREAYDESKPKKLEPGEWHLPYVDRKRQDDGALSYSISFDSEQVKGKPSMKVVGTQFLTLEEAIKVSSARCAAVSFRNVDYGVEKSIEVYNRLIGDERKHSSAMEHQATPMKPSGFMETNVAAFPGTWEEGISHADRKGQLWSGNFKGWIQNRKLVSGENVPG